MSIQSEHKGLIAQNNQRWEGVTFKPHSYEAAKHVAQRLIAPKAKAIYQALEHATSVPWYVIAMIHEREASQSWNANIAQGDPWNRRSVHEPKGRGPFTSFHAAAVDALTNCHPYAARWTDWSVGGLLTLLELYNGEGYEKFHHMASPYLWSGTNRYSRGKYVSDGHFDPSVVDSQLGCAVLYQAMTELDPSIAQPAAEQAPEPEEEPIVDDSIHGEPPAPVRAPAPEPEPEPPNWLKETAKSKVQDAASNVDVVSAGKSLWKSKIGWATIGLGGTTVANTAAQAPASVLDRIWANMHTPTFWLIVLNIGLVITILYFYWRDHGKGAIR